MSVIWILGAPDAEMTTIEKLLRECGQRVYLAVADGQRVRPGAVAQDLVEALPDGEFGALYRPDPTLRPQDVIAIEVAGPWGAATIDHHEGHERASWGPERFLQASSLGQVIEWLARMSALPSFWPHGWGPPAESGPGSEGVWCQLGELMVSDGHWTVCTLAPGWGVDACFATIPQALVTTAAADHCLAAAAAGACPGVDPVAFRAAIISQQPVRGADAALTTEQRISMVEQAIATLRAAPPALDLCPPQEWMGGAEAGQALGDMIAVGPHTGVRALVRDLTGHPVDGDIVPLPGGLVAEQFPAVFPFGPVAASLAGLGYVVRGRRWTRAALADEWVQGPEILRVGGCGKETVPGPTPIERWLAGAGETRGCLPADAPRPDNLYGVPARGFGGGTLIDQG